jgi:hypothetical protein
VRTGLRCKGWGGRKLFPRGALGCLPSPCFSARRACSWDTQNTLLSTNMARLYADAGVWTNDSEIFLRIVLLRWQFVYCQYTSFLRCEVVSLCYECQCLNKKALYFFELSETSSRWVSITSQKNLILIMYDP